MPENSSLALAPARQGVEDSLPLILPSEKHLLLTGVLKQVSRSFYLTMRILPGGMREPVCLAYLLARAADSITDNNQLPARERLRHLEHFRAQLDKPYSKDHHQHLLDDLEVIASTQAEKRLLQSLPKLYALLHRQAPTDQREVVAVVEVLTRGMVQDLEWFGEPNDDPRALADSQQLDQYCYLVAGCVGEFWTNMLVYHIPVLKKWDLPYQRKLGMELGKALQLTNILRDIATDLREGRCYLPESELRESGLEATDLLSVLNTERCRPLLHKWIRQALAYFDSGEQYLRSIPRSCLRLRLAVVWPMLIGLRTLCLLADNPHWLNPACRIKVRRLWVYKMMLVSLGAVVSNGLMGRWFESYRKQIKSLPTA